MRYAFVYFLIYCMMQYYAVLTYFSTILAANTCLTMRAINFPVRYREILFKYSMTCHYGLQLNQYINGINCRGMLILQHEVEPFYHA